MTRTCLSFSVVVAGLALAIGCRSKPPAPSAPPAPMVEKVAPVDPDKDLAPAMRLALQKLNGGAEVDKVIAEIHGVVRQNLLKDDNWVLLGRAWVRKARESNDPGFYLNADACASVVLDCSPEQSPAQDLRGLVFLNQHKFGEARDLALKVVAKHPEDPMAWGTLGDALLEMGRYEEAADAVQKMVDLKPNLPSYSRAAHLQWLHCNAKNAAETVRLAIDSGRDAKHDAEPGAWVLVQAAMMFWNAGDYEGADAGFDRALDRVPSYAPANVGKGRVAMARGEYTRAADLFQRALDASPLVETAWLLGDAREAAGDTRRAAEAFARVEKDGRKTDPRTLSLFFSTKNRNVDEALTLAREEYETRKDIVTEDALAWALYRKGSVAEAKASIVKARRLGTPDARLLYHEGAIRIAAGEGKHGRELVLQARKMNRTFDATATSEIDSLLARDSQDSRETSSAPSVATR